MHHSVAKLIVYNKLPENSILGNLAEIFQTFESCHYRDDELITSIYREVKRILDLGTTYGFDQNLWHNYLTYELITNVPAKVISADSNLLARLFDNLINNAIKYGADGKRVIVRIDAGEDIVTVRVKNYGYVIPEDEVGQIFNRFYRVDQSRTSSVSGSGLGLAIAKNIVDMHGGTIGVTSDLNGTVFTVKLKTELDADRENFDIAR